MMQAAPLAYMSNTSLAPVPDMGEKAPDFELPDVDQNWRKLSDFMGKKTIVAFFPARRITGMHSRDVRLS